MKVMGAAGRAAVVSVWAAAGLLAGGAEAAETQRPAMACPQVAGKRTVCADVAALDQTLVYNRFGSFNPFGMIFALTRDLSDASIAPTRIDADACAQTLGTEPGVGPLAAGAVRLKDCKRARPLVLRANPGDILHLRLTNLLREQSPGFSDSFCRQKDGSKSTFFRAIRNWVSQGSSSQVDHHEVACEQNSAEKPAETTGAKDAEWPRTRGLNFAIQGLTALNASGEPTGAPDACIGLAAIAPGASVDCYYAIDREGPYFMSSTAAPSGGEGDGGSITHGLFGAVLGERKDTRWFRSQVTRAAFDTAWNPTTMAPHARVGSQVGDMARYGVKHGDVPILDMLMQHKDGGFEIVHSDLNAIVYREGIPGSKDPDEQPVSFREFSVFFHDELKSFATRNFEELNAYGQLAGVRDGFAINYGASGMGAMLLANRKGIGPAANCKECFYEEFFLTSWANGDPALLESFPDDPSNVHHSYLNDATVFRNFHAGPKETHVFHLHAHQWFSGNDRGRGSYLDSQTIAPQQGFTYNIYDGGLNGKTAAETPGDGWADSRGSGNRNRTLGDSIFHCHLYPHFAQGMWELWRVHDVLEDGSRVLPDGQLEPGLSLAEVDDKIKLKKRPGSVDPRTGQRIVHKRDASAQLDDLRNDRLIGTPIPALVPLPGQAWPLLPTYPAEVLELDPNSPPAPAQAAAEINTMPGYPFYIAGRPGHRPPQAPMDIARAVKDVKADEGAGAVVVKAGQPLDGGLPRHVVTDAAERELSVKLPPSVKIAPLPAGIDEQKDALSNLDVRKRERQQAQYIAKILAMGDMTAHISSAPMELMPYDGTPLEKAAMAFHGTGALGSGAALELKKADGSGALPDMVGGYGSLGDGVAAFQVNGAPPKPGAPFADPCGVARQTATTPSIDDPFVKFGATAPPKFFRDPAMKGFRRYEGSAVQLDLVTNRAGWHDPQARINVLTAVSDRYKDDAPDTVERPRAAISPRVSASEEPFFFRALSGECIEFRHTNELPKDLALDDFEVRTPTDTIGQHIHLVKFDVTSSDGSGNGFNYEDGTFAPDEVAARICAGKTAGVLTKASRENDELALREDGLCEAKTVSGKIVHHVKHEFENIIWRKRRSVSPHLFQTTTQRWFADPILSSVRANDDEAVTEGTHDRTLRTVFTHDHFGPSSIQQHGFYSALIIEPLQAKVCDPKRTLCTPQKPDAGFDGALKLGDGAWVGASKVVRDPQSLDKASPDFREFALAIADFATLYDPRDSESEQELLARIDGANEAPAVDERSAPKGLATLYCEAKHAGDPAAMAKHCGSALAHDQSGHWAAGVEDTPPAWIAAKRPGDLAAHSDGLLDNTITTADVDELRQNLVEYRRKAAGFKTDGPNARLAKPVNPPQRPESISVDHHDPYLLNYRGEPLPLRVGRGGESDSCTLQPLGHWVAALAIGVTERCSIEHQKAFPAGDMANVFQSSLHGDPATPVFESYTSDRVLFRLIQGAQEVQHTFTLEGYNWPRNIDHRFPSAAHRPSDATPEPLTLSRACEQRVLKRTGLDDLKISGSGRPDQYSNWLRRGSSVYPEKDRKYWKAYEAYQAECLNVEGRVTAQEVGISEHFEFSGAYRNDIIGAEKRLASKNKSGREDIDELRKALTPTDTLQHFGSVDSLWNGAWGLLRVYQSKDAIDAGKIGACVSYSDASGETSELWGCLEKLSGDSANTIGARLPTLPKPQNVTSAAELTATSKAATPVVVECRHGAPVVYAAAVAIETDRVFKEPLQDLKDEGTPYGRRLYDRNGLFLAIVDPEVVANPNSGGRPREAWLGEEAAWTDIDAGKVEDAVRQAYERPEPFALHVRAGDCVKLTVINALREHRFDSSSHADRPGLKDDLGDAPMPKITPLNVEPAWSSGQQIVESALENTPLRFTQQDRSNLRPSARLALGLPLPVLNHQQDVSRPFGWNRKGALAPSRTDRLTIVDSDAWGLRSANIEQLTFYAGRTGIDPDFGTDRAVLVTDTAKIKASMVSGPLPLHRVQDGLFKDIRSALGLGEDDFIEIVQKPIDDGADASAIARMTAEATFTTGSSLFDIKVKNVSIASRLSADETLKDKLQALSSGYVKKARSAAVNWIPYAFGALPVKSSGDVIGHSVHGLFGAVVVHPKAAAFATGPSGQTTVPLTACADEKTGEHCVFKSTRGVAEKPFVPWATSYSVKDNAMFQPEGVDAKPHNIRSFTLFWQDGLNLRDRATQDEWDGRDTVSGASLHPKLVADCKICDDSYDWGEAGVNYRSAPFHIRLRSEPNSGSGPSAERHYNLNAFQFGEAFFKLRADEAGLGGKPEMPVLRAEAGEEVVIGALHPGGRARQRSLVMIGHDYDDLFPGFGFPHSALLAPGKAVSAALRRPVRKGCSLWFDGPTQLRAAGTWGLLDVVDKGRSGDVTASECVRPGR